jgi:uncharacterized protein (UPF0333 family)
MLNAIRTLCSRFARDERGSIAVEAAIWLPTVLAIMAGIYSLHDMQRHKSLNIKAAYTISDAISRQTDPIDNAYLTGMNNLLGYLTHSTSGHSLRVTLVRYNGKKKKYVAEWSKTRGSFGALKTRDLTSMYSKLPTMLHNERVIVVETETDYQPPIKIPGVSTSDLFYNYGFTRPRFAPKVVWSNG